VQKDRIEASVWAFGRGKESWLVEHRVLMGDTARDAVWKRLAEMLGETWTHASGAAMPWLASRWTPALPRRRPTPSCGPAAMPRDGGQGCARGRLDRHADRRRCLAGRQEAAPGIKVYSVAVGIAKLEFYNNLRKSADVGEDGIQTTYPVGFVHLPKIDAEFIQQLCAEQLITRRDRNGFPVREWQKMRERNEALDCYVYARAAASSAGLDRFEDGTGGAGTATWARPARRGSRLDC
jgi:phage terminase large subunit GpA-like protein